MGKDQEQCNITQYVLIVFRAPRRECLHYQTKITFASCHALSYYYAGISKALLLTKRYWEPQCTGQLGGANQMASDIV